MSQISPVVQIQGYILWPFQHLPSSRPGDVADVIQHYRQAWEEARSIARPPVTERLMTSISN
jgi:hypothetical protein